jgi:hypothetical protein
MLGFEVTRTPGSSLPTRVIVPPKECTVSTGGVCVGTTSSARAVVLVTPGEATTRSATRMAAVMFLGMVRVEARVENLERPVS